MFDDRVYPTEGEFEGKEPVGRLFRNIEEFFMSSTTLSSSTRRLYAVNRLAW